jgi:hypothetical protein
VAFFASGGLKKHGLQAKAVRADDDRRPGQVRERVALSPEQAHLDNFGLVADGMSGHGGEAATGAIRAVVLFCVAVLSAGIERRNAVKSLATAFLGITFAQAEAVLRRSVGIDHTDHFPGGLCAVAIGTTTLAKLIDGAFGVGKAGPFAAAARDGAAGMVRRAGWFVGITGASAVEVLLL